MPAGRYHRQTLLPQVGDAGQRRLGGSTVAVLGCGALGTVAAENLCRAGVGRLVLIDRDLVEPSNLQRQTLFTEADADESRPKAVAAADRLRAVNSRTELDPRPVDADAANVAELVADADVVVDGTDNAATRYLLNDARVKSGRPWVYGAAVGVEGRVMPVRPGAGPCLRCVFPDPPPAGALATCDTAGVLAAAAGVVGNLQAAAAIRLLLDSDLDADLDARLTAFDAWTGTFRSVSVARDADCPCCGRGEFPFLDAPPADLVTLCGRDAVQVRPPSPTRLDLPKLAARLGVGATRFVVRFEPRPGVRASVFADGRMLAQGARDAADARSIYARYVGG